MTVLAAALLGAISGAGGGVVAHVVVAKRPALLHRKRTIMVVAAIAFYVLLRTAAGPTIRRWELRSEVAEVEAANPMLRVLFTAEPSLREAYLTRLDSAIAAGARPDEVRGVGVEFGRQLGITRLARYLAITTDSAAADFAAAFLETMTALGARDPVDCVDLVFGRTGNGTRAAATLSRAQEARLVSAMNAVFLQADQAPRSVVTLAERDSLLARVRVEIRERHGDSALEDLGRANALGWRVAEPARACGALIHFYEAVRELPPPDGGRLVRGLLGHYEPADTTPRAGPRRS